MDVGDRGIRDGRSRRRRRPRAAASPAEPRPAPGLLPSSSHPFGDQHQRQRSGHHQDRKRDHDRQTAREPQLAVQVDRERRLVPREKQRERKLVERDRECDEPPATTAGAISGSTIRASTVGYDAPRSIAASSRSRSKSDSRATTISTTYGSASTVCPIATVPSDRSMPPTRNSTSNATASTTTGTISGSITSVNSNGWLQNWNRVRQHRDRGADRSRPTHCRRRRSGLLRAVRKHLGRVEQPLIPVQRRLLHRERQRRARIERGAAAPRAARRAEESNRRNELQQVSRACDPAACGNAINRRACAGSRPAVRSRPGRGSAPASRPTGPSRTASWPPG